MLKCSELV